MPFYVLFYDIPDFFIFSVHLLELFKLPHSQILLIFLRFSSYSSFKLPVLAAAPDIKHPFSRISPINLPYFTQKPTAIRGNPSQYPPFYTAKPPKTLLYPPPTPKTPVFPLKNPPNPYFFRFFILFPQKFRILSTFNTGRFNPLLFPIFPDFQEIIKFPALSLFSPISWPKTPENPIFPPKPPFFHRNPNFSIKSFPVLTPSYFPRKYLFLIKFLPYCLLRTIHIVNSSILKY